MSSEDKIREGAQQYLHSGEQVLAAFVARPRGYTQQRAGARPLGRNQQAHAREAADQAGFAIGSPMAIAITQYRLLSLRMGAQVGMGIGGGVEELIGEAPLADVDSLSTTRLLVGKVVNITVRGESFKLEVGAGANTKGVVEAYNSSK